MTYLICEKCGHKYPLEEGKSSFNYQNCHCGGKLKYYSLKEGSVKNNQNQSTYPSGISWKGVLVGFLFLFISLILSVVALFGTDIPTSASSISSLVLTIFSILAIILTIASGSISAYLSGSIGYVKGAINGIIVGVILGFVLGIVGGPLVFLSGILVFGLLSMLGGIIGTLPRRHLK